MQNELNIIFQKCFTVLLRKETNPVTIGLPPNFFDFCLKIIFTYAKVI